MRTEIDWELISDLIKAGIEPDMIKRAYLAAQSVGRMQVMEPWQRAMVVGTVLAYCVSSTEQLANLDEKPDPS